MRLAIGGDHLAVTLKEEIMAHVRELGHTPVDFGVFSDQPSDYPYIAEKAALAVARGDCDMGLLFCGTGLGMMLAANKVRGVRCAACSDCYSAAMARRHNDANMLALGARVLGSGLARLLVDTFLSTAFEGGRHAARVALIMELENRSLEGDMHE